MAGRPLGLRSLMKALSRYSRVQLEKLIASVPTKSEVVAKLERQREKLANAIAKLDRRITELSGGNGAVAAPARRTRKSGRKKGYKLSPATRAKMRAAALLRYGKTKSAAAPAAKKRRTMSAETRAKMAAAAKARWAKKKGAEGPKVESNA